VEEFTVQLMFLLAILVGIGILVAGVYLLILAKRTPKDKPVPFGIEGDAWTTHTAAYVRAFAVIFIALLCILAGLTVS
jgi:uncharacterized membrane protein